jgi:hypothetical protein
VAKNYKNPRTRRTKIWKKIQKFRNKSYKNLGIKISKIREQIFQKSRNRS